MSKEFEAKTILTLKDENGEKTFKFSGKRAEINGEISPNDYSILGNAVAAVATLNLKTDKYISNVETLVNAMANMPENTTMDIEDVESGLHVSMTRAALETLKTLIENVKIEKSPRANRVTGNAILTF